MTTTTYTYTYTLGELLGFGPGGADAHELLDEQVHPRLAEPVRDDEIFDAATEVLRDHFVPMLDRGEWARAWAEASTWLASITGADHHVPTRLQLEQVVDRADWALRFGTLIEEYPTWPLYHDEVIYDGSGPRYVIHLDELGDLADLDDLADFDDARDEASP